ncbi:MAG: PGF-CTERM sorting domain-containing protein [Halobacteriota archaeon]|nr:PGF-CTERM sorting domain-containing protein [Halobacteriota archaeon]
MKKEILLILLVVSLIVQLVVGSASAEYNGDSNLINYGTTNLVLRGQTLTFNNNDSGHTIIGKSGELERRVITTAINGLDSSIFPEMGVYFIDSNPSTSGGYDPGETILSVNDPILVLHLKRGSLDISDAPFVTIGDILTVDITSNLDTANDTVSLKVIRLSDGVEINQDGAGHYLKDRSISYLDGLNFDTSNLKTGDYDFYLQTKSSAAQGLDLRSESVSLADETSPHKDDDEGEDTVPPQIPTNEHGRTTSEILILSSDGKVSLSIPKETLVIDSKGEVVKEINITHITPMEDDSNTSAAYNISIDILTFDPPVDLIVEYDPEKIPKGANESDIVIKMYIDGEWASFETMVDESEDTVSAKIDRLNNFALFAEVKVSPSPTMVPTPTVTTEPPEESTQEPTLQPDAVQEPEEEPGFGAVFTITGLLAVAYLMTRRDRR